MDYSKLKLNEENKINIFANMVIKDTLQNIRQKDKYTNLFNRGIRKNVIDEYIFYFILAEKNMELFMDSANVLNGELIGNKYNSFLSEDNIILLFMRLKLYIFSGISKLNYDSVFQNIYDKRILQYEDFLDKDTQLLEKDIDNRLKKDLILDEIKKIRLSSLGFYLILSYYIYKYDTSKKTIEDKKNFILFIEKVEKNIDDFFKKTNDLNIDLDKFWKYLISCI